MLCANPKCNAVSDAPQGRRSSRDERRPPHIALHGHVFWVCDNCSTGFGWDAVESPGEELRATPASSTDAGNIQRRRPTRGSERDLTALMSGVTEVRGILTSWKEIAGYLGKGVRTVQRWESLFGLPIRRPIYNQHCAIMAIREEIDLWVNTRTQPRSSESENHKIELLRCQVTALQQENASLRTELRAMLQDREEAYASSAAA